MNRRGLLAMGALALLSGCAATPSVSDYGGQTPRLDLREYFNGTLDAHGVFTDRSGKVMRRFVVLMQARWNGNEGTLDELFTYSDGQTQRRVWRLRDEGNGRYSGRADDVVGEATGEASGNALRWSYTLRLPVDGREFDVQFDDWMYLVDSRVLLNKAVMSKFGVRLGEVTLSMSRRCEGACP